MASYEERTYRRKKADGSYVEVKRYKATVTIKGFPRTSKIFDRKTDARAWAEKTEYEYKHQIDFGGKQHRNKTMAEVFERYEKALKLSNPLRHEDIAPVLDWWKKKTGHVTLGRLSKDLIVQQRDALKSRHVKNNAARNKLANASVNRMMGILSRVLNVAVDEWGWLGKNPMDGIKPLPEPKGRTRFLQGDEQKRLLAAAKRSENSDLYCIIVLAITTGARRGEIVTIRLKDVNFETGRILLPKTKNGKARTLYLVGPAHALVRQVYDRAQKGQEYLFVSPRDRRQPNDFRTAWRKTLKRAELSDFKFHDLRHTAASFYAQHGAGLHQIAEILGHTGYHVTKRYTHLLETDTARVVETTAMKVFADDLELEE